MTFDHRTAATLHLSAGGFRYLSGREFGIRDLRPYRLTLSLQRVNFRHAGFNGGAQAVEHRLHIANLGAQRLLHLANRRFRVGGQRFVGKGHRHINLAIFRSKVKCITGDTLS